MLATALVLASAGSPLLAYVPAPPPQIPLAQASPNASQGTAATPAGSVAPAATGPASALTPQTVSSRQAREADDAYLAGARAIERQDLTAAERHFTIAATLNSNNRDYALALAVTREHRLTELVQNAAKARLANDSQRADALLSEARVLDPENAVVTQHFGPAGLLPSPFDPAPRASPVAATLAGAPELAPKPGRQSFHQRGTAPELLRAVYSAFGLRSTLDPGVGGAASIKLDLDDVDFATAAGILDTLSHTFAVPLDSHSALLADDTPQNRDRLEPRIEETLFLPGTSTEALNDLATLARNVFDLKQVTPGPGSGTLLVRGDPPTLRLLNATFADMLGGGSDVMLDLTLYEVDRTRTREIGTALPTSAGAFSIAATAQQLVTANQTVVNQAIAQGVITLSGNSLTDLIREVGFLIASGVVTSSQYTNLLGIFGGGLSLAGLYLGSNATLNLLLNSSDVRVLDAVQLRAGERQASSFRAGTRYPIVTSTFSTGISSSTAASVAGLSINGTSVSSLLSQYLGTSSVTVPQIQFEDLGLTLKTTPQVLRDGSVFLQLDLKLEALGGGTINSIPILNSRTLTSSVTVPSGQTAMLVSQVSSTELRSLQGLPGLNELPGFSGTDRTSERDTTELLITLTPHVIRRGDLRIESRALAVSGGAKPESE